MLRSFFMLLFLVVFTGVTFISGLLQTATAEKQPTTQSAPYKPSDHVTPVSFFCFLFFYTACVSVFPVQSFPHSSSGLTTFHATISLYLLVIFHKHKDPRQLPF